MKHTTEELLLAVQIMQMAANARQGAMPRDLTPDQQADWRKANPTENFVPEVMAKVTQVANTIKDIR